MSRADLNKNQQLSDFLNFSKELTEEEKELQAAAMVGMIDEIEVERACKNVMARIEKFNKVKKISHYISRIAAILAIPLLIYTAWSVYSDFSEKQLQVQLAEQEFNSPTGMRSRIILPDGTKVWLNAESTLRYSVPFIGETRNVFLEGEAFLEVEHNKRSPFVVSASNTTVEVTGTSFNVKAYPKEECLLVALKEGSVKLNASDGNESKTIELLPGDVFEVDKNTKVIKKVDSSVEKQIAWHDNVLVLDDTPMEEVAVLLERWYGVKVFITDESLKKYKFSTTFENEPLNRVLELLELSSPTIKITYKPGKLNQNPGEKNYSVVTISKK